MAQNLKFFFAWCQPTETTFGPQHMRWDENVFSHVIEHVEGQIPTMTLTIRTPSEGLLSPGRLYWAWMAVSLDGGATATPLFFGRIVGLPTELDPSARVVEVHFIARPSNYIPAKQAVAETLKYQPYYDPVFIDPMKRDDPETIIEAVSALYHVDRVTQAVSVSDVLVGEDGTDDFTGSGDAFYDSVKMHLDQSPLVAVTVMANVKWRQQYMGFFDVTSGTVQTFTGVGFAADWPTSGSNLGGGYTAAIAYAANETAQIDMAQQVGNYGYHYSWQNTSATPQQGDVMNIDLSYSVPLLGQDAVPGTFNVPGLGVVGEVQPSGPGLAGIIKYVYKSESVPGIIDPFNVYPDGTPNPINQPAKVEQAWLEIPGWNVVYALSLAYQADRERTERLQFTLSSDVQPTLADPLVTEDTEIITLSGADVSQPIINFLNWSSVAGQAVALNTFVFPDNPSVPGQSSAQVCVVAGTAGTTEPTFSNIAGVTTVDGTVTWASLGDSQPTQSLPDWQQAMPIGLGSRLCPRPMLAVDINSLTKPGLLTFPPKLTAASKYQVLVNGTSYPGCTLMECTAPGFIVVAGGALTNSPASFQNFTNPTGKTWWICTSPGVTGEFHTSFPDTPGATVTDGTVTWTCVAFVDLPVGGWPGMTGARSYFPSDRGKQSIHHLLARARAKLRWRARVAKVTWQTPYANAINLSCRKNASLAASGKLPGGQATGKVISYKLVGDGDSGRFYGEITIGCAAGNANAIAGADGTAVYVDGVFDPGEVEVWTGAVLLLPTHHDMGYTPPTEQMVDDGLIFPLVGKGDAIMDFTEGGSSALESQAIQNALQQIKFSQGSSYTFPVGGVGGQGTVSQQVPNFLAVQQQLATEGMVGLWKSLTLRPLNVGPFDAGYVLSVTDLMIPKTIDLEAASGRMN